MNFIDMNQFARVSACNGLRPGGPDALASLNSVMYRLVKTLLDAARVLSNSSTIRPEDIRKLAKLQPLLSLPAAASKSSKRGGGGQRGGSSAGSTVLPPEYFGGHPEHPGFLVDSMSIARPALFNSAFSPGGGGGQQCGGGAGSTVLPPEYFGSALGQCGGGAGRQCGFLDKNAVNKLIDEYRARAGGSNIRVSDAAKQLIRRQTDANVHGLLAHIAAAKKTRVTAAALAKAWSTWQVRF